MNNRRKFILMVGAMTHGVQSCLSTKRHDPSLNDKEVVYFKVTKEKVPQKDITIHIVPHQNFDAKIDLKELNKNFYNPSKGGKKNKRNRQW